VAQGLSRPPPKVLFVCTGNTCRSPIASVYFRSLCEARGLTDVEVESAGLAAVDGAPMSAQARAVLEREGLCAGGESSALLTEEMADGADLIVVMTAGHKRDVARRWPGVARRTRLLLSFAGPPLDVSDPYLGSLQDYVSCLETMKPALAALADELASGREES